MAVARVRLRDLTRDERLLGMLAEECVRVAEGFFRVSTEQHP